MDRDRKQRFKEIRERYRGAVKEYDGKVAYAEGRVLIANTKLDLLKMQLRQLPNVISYEVVNERKRLNTAIAQAQKEVNARKQDYQVAKAGGSERYNEVLDEIATKLNI